MRKYWKIEGFDGLDKTFEFITPCRLGEVQIKAMLQRLASRHLAPEVVALASLRRDMPGYRSDLQVDRAAGPKAAWMTTGNPHYTARIISDLGQQ